MRPAGAIGFVRPSGVIGRIIAWRQGVGFSHAIIALGNGKVADATVPYVRVLPESYWDAKQVEWYEPTRPFGVERVRQLRSLAYMSRGRIAYSILSLVAFVLRGVPGKRGHGVFCTYFVAEAYLLVRNEDLSGVEQPWNVDIRELLGAVRRGSFRRIA